MANLSLFPNYLLREWTADGKPLSGGTLSFYQSGSFTPKAVYADAFGNVSLGNVVTLDASGSAVIFMGRGAYRVWLKQANGVQVAPYVDGVVGGGVGIDTQSDLNVAFVKNYDELRLLTGDIDVVYVSGRSEEGDGGAGWFQYIPSDISTDNDGTLLVTALGQKVYSRIFDGYLDCRWFGVAYGNDDSYYTLLQALNVSAALNFPVLISGAVYIAQNLIVPDGANIEFTDGAFIHTGASALTVTFSAGSHLKATSRIFGTNIYPKIAKGVCDELPISWMAGQVDDDRLDKLWLASTDPTQIVVIDEDISVLATTWVCQNHLRFANSSIITFTGTGSLNLTAKYIEPIQTKTFEWTTNTYTADFGDRYLFVEQFGAVGDGTIDNSAVLHKAIGFWRNLEFAEGNTYAILSNLYFSSASIRGFGSIIISPSASITCDIFDVDGVSIFANDRTTLSNKHTITARDSFGLYSLDTSANLLYWYDVYSSDGNVKYGSVKQQAIVANKFQAGSDAVMAVGRVVVLPTDVTSSVWLTADILVARDATLSNIYNVSDARLANVNIYNIDASSGYVSSTLIKPSMPNALYAGSIGGGPKGELLPVAEGFLLQYGVDYTYTVDNLSFFPAAPTIVEFTANITPITRNYVHFDWILHMSGATIPLLSNQQASITITVLSDRLKSILGNSNTRYQYNKYIGRTSAIGNVADSISTQYAVNAPWMVSCTFTSPYVLTFKFYSGDVGNWGPSPANTSNTPNPAMGWIDIFSEWLPPNSGTIHDMRYIFGTEGYIYNNGPAE